MNYSIAHKAYLLSHTLTAIYGMKPAPSQYDWKKTLLVPANTVGEYPPFPFYNIYIKRVLVAAAEPFTNEYQST